LTLDEQDNPFALAISADCVGDDRRDSPKHAKPAQGHDQ
jgi:hypothetical protein